MTFRSDFLKVALMVTFFCGAAGQVITENVAFCGYQRPKGQPVTGKVVISGYQLPQVCQNGRVIDSRRIFVSL